MEVRFLGVDGKEVVLDLPNSYFERGYKKGLEEGREEVREEERKELLQTIPIAIKMLLSGMDLQLIVEKTGLSQTEVEKIKQQLENL
ncbi:MULTISPECIES: hypothetical protein [Heyndrickxia]|jgi:predicted transposase YdaD|uniref:Uncharacterized protein n=1 Tax=Heyndrickxia coagulans TaxID=1398 RepID=A0AAW7CNB0_HEYCO|nr:hypothetical protein [Heyndrickxia coagulans]MDL5042428.1 hypothetical protein [Heyndrickxia coagulans]